MQYRSTFIGVNSNKLDGDAWVKNSCLNLAFLESLSRDAYVPTPVRLFDGTLERLTILEPMQGQLVSDTLDRDGIGTGSLPRPGTEDDDRFLGGPTGPILLPPIPDVRLPEVRPSWRNRILPSAPSEGMLVQSAPNRFLAAKPSESAFVNLNWKYLFQQRLQLHRNWLAGRYLSQPVPGHNEAIYCLQFDEEKMVTGGKDSRCLVTDFNY
jgi:hypothetical protein